MYGKKVYYQRIKILFILLFIVAILPLFTSQVNAHPPEKMTLTYDINTKMLNVTITHIVKNTTEHYIKTLTIEKNNVLILTKQYDSQPSTTSFTYTYPINAIGSDEITVTAYCIISGSLQEQLIVPFYGQNQPPESPTISGPSQGRINIAYSFTFCSTDPDGDSIYYCVDWGDGGQEVCIRPYPSGACVTIEHVWTEEQTYKITVVAKDTKNAESTPATHKITLPKSKTYQSYQPYDILSNLDNKIDYRITIHHHLVKYYIEIFKFFFTNININTLL